MSPRPTIPTVSNGGDDDGDDDDDDDAKSRVANRKHGDRLLFGRNERLRFGHLLERIDGIDLNIRYELF